MLETHVKIIKHKVGLLNLAEELGNVSSACKTMGLSRDTFYRYKAAVESGGVEGLFDKSRRQPNLKNRVDDLTEQAVLRHALPEVNPALYMGMSLGITFPFNIILGIHLYTYLAQALY